MKEDPMNRRRWSAFLALLILLGVSTIAVAQEPSPTARILVVDATKTFDSTLRVAGVVGALRQTGLFEVSIRLSEDDSSFPDPLRDLPHPPEETPFDLILLLPRALDTRTDVMIWLISNWVPWLSPSVRQAAEVAKAVANEIFADVGTTVDGSMDLWPVILGTLYVQSGWIR
jgi:hypothetical protein